MDDLDLPHLPGDLPHDRWMRLALAEARAAAEAKQGPNAAE